MYLMRDGWYWVDAGRGCGGIKVRKGRVAYSCPIFRWMEGKSVYWIADNFKMERLDDSKNKDKKANR